MAAFVISHAQFFVGVDHALPLFQAGRHTFHTFVEFLHADRRFAIAGRQERRFIDQIRQIGADEARGQAGHFSDVHRRMQLDVLHVNFENILAPADIGPIDQHMAIETARPQERGVERLGPVGGGHHDHAAVGAEAVHLDQQGIQRLLAFVVSADDARAARFSQRVELVDEDDARRLGLGLLEHIAHPGRANADEHFDEVGAREPEERHARLAGDGLGQQRFARAGRSDQQYAFGNPAAESLIALRRAEKVDHFAQLVDRLVDAGHVLERDSQIFLGIHLAAAPAESHRRSGPTELAQHDEQHADDQAPHQQRLNPIGLPNAGAFDVRPVDVVRFEQLLDILVVVGRAVVHTERDRPR